MKQSDIELGVDYVLKTDKWARPRRVTALDKDVEAVYKASRGGYRYHEYPFKGVMVKAVNNDFITMYGDSMICKIESVPNTYVVGARYIEEPWDRHEQREREIKADNEIHEQIKSHIDIRVDRIARKIDGDIKVNRYVIYTSRDDVLDYALEESRVTLPLGDLYRLAFDS